MTPTQLMKAWIKNIVVGENLCPFARNSNHTPEIIEVRLENLEDKIPKVIHQVLDPENSLTNAIIVVTSGLEVFDDFWNLCCALEENLEKSELINAIQLAHFHPHYTFSALSDSDRANWTNRSPFPALHFLCAITVEDEIARFPDASEIPTRNMKHLREMNESDFRRLFGAVQPRLRF